MKPSLTKHSFVTLFILLIIGLLTEKPQADEFPLNLMFSKQDVPRIRENTQLPMFKDYWQSLLDADVKKDHNLMREAFIYAVTGDRKRGELARQEMLEVLKKKRWDYFLEDGKHTLGFLRAGRMTAWMSLAYDWIYDLLSPKERAEILKQIKEKGCEPCYLSLYGMRYPETVKGWGFDPEYPDHYEVPDMSRWPVILGHNNFRAVISGGMALGMFTLGEQDDRFSDYFEILMDSYYRFIKLINSDGSYDEGMSYCNYAMTYLIYFMEVMQRKRGIELFDAANYPGMIDCNLALFLPHHLEPAGSVNFGDAGNSLNSAVSFWIAKKSRDGVAQHVAMNYPRGHDIFSLVYYDPKVKPVLPSNKDYFRRLELDWITIRTGYGIDDLVVAMRSGPPSNHENADRNSIILKFGGEILLTDTKHPTYDPNSPGWLLRTSPAHNTVLIDGKGHQYHNGEEGTNASKASAKIVRFGERQNYVFWASDATPAYNLIDEDVKSVTRTVLVFDKIPAMIVLDKLIKKQNPSILNARWHIENSDKKGKGTFDKNSFVISRPHARLYGVCAGSPEIQVDSDFLPVPESFGAFPFVDVVSTQQAKEAFILMAATLLEKNETLPGIEIQNNQNKWTINLTKDDQKLKVLVLDRDELPEFEIIEIK